MSDHDDLYEDLDSSVVAIERKMVGTSSLEQRGLRQRLLGTRHIIL